MAFLKTIKNLTLGICISSLAFSLTSCDNEDSVFVKLDPPVKITDLSADEMANCYIVQSPGLYKFKADNRFNLGPGLPVPPEINPVSAGLVWQTEPGLISSVELQNEENSPYIVFEVSKAIGNALLAVYDEEGEVQWSWHIWMPKDQITSVATSTGYEVMNMNLGAVENMPGSPLSYGMLYQWGRKDPFPASATATGDTSTIGLTLYDMEGEVVSISNSSWASNTDNTLLYSIANPTVCLSNYSQFITNRDWLKAEEGDDSLWGNPEGYVRDSDNNVYPNKGVKTCYDPSPAGWRVAPVDAFRDFTSSGGYAWDFSEFNIADYNNDGILSLDDYNYGWFFNVSDSHALYFPATSRYDGSYGMLMGSMAGLWGNYWSNAPYPSIAGGAFCNLSFQVKSMTGTEVISVSPSAGSSKADAYSIRCVRD